MKAGQIIKEITQEDWSPKNIDLTIVADLIEEVPENEDMKPEEAFKLAVKSARVLDRLAEECAKAELYYLRARSNYRDIYETTSSNYDGSVAAGDRYAHTDDLVKLAREKRDYSQVYLSLIQNKVNAIEKLHYVCKQKHDKAEREISRSNTN